MSRPQLSHSSFSRLSINDEEDDDDAWAADSDDESKQSRFTQRPSQQQPRLTRPMLATGGTGSRSVSTSSIQTNSSSSSSVSSSRRHAPPARPHPFPIPPSSASSQQRSASSSSSPALSGWTMVDARTGKASMTASSTSLAGSPPTDVGSTAAEAVIKAASEAQHTSRPSSSVRSQAQPTETGVSLSRTKSRESSAFVRAIRPDLPGVVNDPFAALDALAAEADMPAAMTAHDSQASTSSDTPALIPVTPRPRTSSSTAPSSRRASRVPREAAHFDPITMGGDGLIMGGGTFGSSSSSLEQVEDDEDEQDVSRQGREEEGDMTVTSDSLSLSTEAPAGASRLSPAQHPPLRRAKSVRTKRRYREFLRCLNSPSPTGTSSSSSNVDLRKLRELSWNGIPSELRPIVWPLLLGYVPANSSMRSAALARKRADYRRAVTLAFGFDPFADGQLDGAQGGEEGEGKVAGCEGEGKKGAAASAATEARTTTPARPSTPQSRSSAAAAEESGRRTPLSVHASRRAGPEEKIWHQIAIDVPRTNPGLPLWQRKGTQRALERLLYVWAIRHHATGYVQGMSDLATPFFEVFLSNYLRPPPDGSASEGDSLDPASSASGMDPQSFDPSHLPLPARLALEADTFWCLSSLLDGIQENYIFAQPGIVRQVRRMEELVARIDAPLHAHLKEQGVEYIQFAFRWMNCLLMREMSVRNVVRLWDTYLAEGADAFSDFHLYVCSVFLCKWSARLREMDFQGCIMFLQSLPTQSWSDKDAELLLSEAFVFKNLFAQTKHLND